VGGTGKTPMVMWIVERLLADGERVGILTRGYRGRQDEQGRSLTDEVAVVRARLGPKAQYGIGANRYEKGLMLARHGVGWFVLDDGFQHLQLARDVDIVLIDATDPFGGGHLLPAGRLREPRTALARADIVVITRSEHAPAVEAVVRRHTRALIFYAQTEFQGVFAVHQDIPALESSDARGKRFFAFCGIGNPAAFFEDLLRWGIGVVGRVAYRDHHRYSSRDAEELTARAQSAGAEAVICTEKDIYNLVGIEFKPLPVFFCRIALRLSSAEEFWRAVTQTIARSKRGAGP
ncbi:MAG TPA: tetraacyldisaccharide 4'-kinase, partial [Candidatus Acidoferrales bacterium]|nr:tetraacyldisaccharide 4'-kinase [Candidatus Acidoferrales bacterium]